MYHIYIKNYQEINLIANTFISKYNDSKMKEISLKAWSYLYQILINDYNININDINIIYNEYNKPYLLNNNLYFNISHSYNIIAIIISDKECGIDIEYIDESRNIDKVIPKIFSESQLFQYQNTNDKITYFYETWTKKEAYFKMLGTGIKLNELNDEIDLQNVNTKIIQDNKQKYCLSYIIK